MPDYQNVKTGCVLRITEKGLQEFIRINFQLGIPYIQQLQIPDIQLNISSFKLKFTDINMQDFVVLPPEVHFLNNNVSAEAIIPNISMALKFQFHLQEDVYPYISDKGEGIIKVSNMFIQLILQMYLNNECPGRYIIDLHNAKSSVEQIYVQMNGNLQLIYDSILYVLTQTIQNNFDALIGNGIIQAVQNIITDNLVGLRPLSPTDIWPIFFYDQRFQKIMMEDQQFIIYTTGQLCMEKANLTDIIILSGYYDPPTYQQLPSYYTNSHIQYSLNILVFQTINNNILLTNRWDQSKSTLLETPIVLKFTNTGLLMRIQAALPDSSIANFTIFGQINFRSKYFSTNLYLMRAQYQAEQIIECQMNKQECNQDQLVTIQNNILMQFNQLQNDLSFSYVNSNNIGECQVLYVSDQWVTGDCLVQSVQNVK